MKLTTIPDAVKLLESENFKVSESKLRRDAQAGKIPSMKVGTRTLIDVDVARQMVHQPRGLGIEAISAETGLKVSTIRRGISEGWIPARKDGRAYEFDLADVWAAIERRMKK